MKTLMFVAAVALTAAAAHAAPPQGRTEAELRALGAAADEAWNRKDAARMARYYAPDATLLVGGATEVVRGRTAIEAYFRQAFAQRPGEMRHVSEFKSLDITPSGAALNDLIVRVEQRQPDGSWKVVRRFYNLSIAIPQDEGWQLQTVRAYPIG